MEEAAAPKTKKQTIEWLRKRLDDVQLELLNCQRKNEELYEVIEDKSDEIHWLSRELDATKRKLAETRAWSRIDFHESEVTREALHRIYAEQQLEDM